MAPLVTIDIREGGAELLTEYARVSIAFEVREVVDVGRVGRADDSTLPVRELEIPYVKDYDAIAGEHPRDWPRRFAATEWALFLAFVDDVHAGGACVALDAPGAAVLWDIRVSPAWRRVGIGAMLFRRAELWASANNCESLTVETQDINVPACKFYQRQGCVLHAVNRGAYPSFPGEVQLIWRKARSSS